MLYRGNSHSALLELGYHLASSFTASTNQELQHSRHVRCPLVCADVGLDDIYIRSSRILAREPG